VPLAVQIAYWPPQSYPPQLSRWLIVAGAAV